MAASSSPLPQLLWLLFICFVFTEYAVAITVLSSTFLLQTEKTRQRGQSLCELNCCFHLARIAPHNVQTHANNTRIYRLFEFMKDLLGFEAFEDGRSFTTFIFIFRLWRMLTSFKDLETLNWELNTVFRSTFWNILWDSFKIGRNSSWIWKIESEFLRINRIEWRSLSVLKTLQRYFVNSLWIVV